jgi:hypothetical protein
MPMVRVILAALAPWSARAAVAGLLIRRARATTSGNALEENRAAF